LTSPQVNAIRTVLSRLDLFSRLVIGRPLRSYQQQPLQAILRSIQTGAGLEFLLVFPRQSGKNEAVAQLLVYLLNLLQRIGGQMVYAAIGDGLGRGMQRLDACLDNPWNRHQWRKAARPDRRMLGRAAVVFVSSHPQASARGETADWLLVIDELQEQDASHLEAVFQPMRAANNATALYIGTVRHTADALWQKRIQLQAQEAGDGQQRVFMVGPDQVIRENPAYGRFLAGRIQQLGREHPIVRSEYYLQPIDGDGGLFPARRRALMRGRHQRQRSPAVTGDQPEPVYVATIDVGGQDEATTDMVARLNNPGRDYTVATLFAVTVGSSSLAHLPVYLALDVFVDHGSRHFQDVPGRPSLVKRLVAWLELWPARHLVVDCSGVGEGLYDWLCARFGRARVTGYPFQGAGKKAALGSAFISLIETGRFKYWQGDEERPLSDGWWFWRQVEACRYELPAAGRFDHHLRWGVPAQAKLSAVGQAGLAIHDDRLLSAALICQADSLWQAGRLALGQAQSAVISPRDPLDDMEF
jgi:hypothetical protein